MLIQVRHNDSWHCRLEHVENYINSVAENVSSLLQQEKLKRLVLSFPDKKVEFVVEFEACHLVQELELKKLKAVLNQMLVKTSGFCRDSSPNGTSGEDWHVLIDTYPGRPPTSNFDLKHISPLTRENDRFG